MKHAVVRVLFAMLLSAVPFHVVRAQSAPDLGMASSFAVLGGTAVTCSSSTIIGDIGINSGAVGACTTSGTIHNDDSVAHQAYADFQTAYGALMTVPCDRPVTGSLAGETLTPGVYCLDNTAKTGLLTLNGQGDPSAVWIFKIGTSGTGDLAGANFNVAISGGGGPCANGAHVFWWTAQSAALTTSNFIGTILAGTYITVTGGSLHGRALAETAVTLTGPSVSWQTILLTPASLPSAWLFNAYAQTVAASGGAEAYTYGIASGSLPTDLALDPLTGLISGTPAAAGIYNFVVCAQDSNGFAGSQSYSILVADPTAAGVFASSNAAIKKGKVTVMWQSNVESGVAQYQVYISKQVDTGFMPVASTVTAPKGNNSSYLVTFPLPQRLKNAKRIYLVVQDLDMNGQAFWSTVSAAQRKAAGKTPKGELLFEE